MSLYFVSKYNIDYDIKKTNTFFKHTVSSTGRELSMHFKPKYKSFRYMAF